MALCVVAVAEHLIRTNNCLKSAVLAGTFIAKDGASSLASSGAIFNEEFWFYQSLGTGVPCYLLWTASSEGRPDTPIH